VCYTTVKEHAGDLPANVLVPFGTDLVNNLEQAEALLEYKIIGHLHPINTRPLVTPGQGAAGNRLGEKFRLGLLSLMI
jgi:hypothetical protein